MIDDDDPVGDLEAGGVPPKSGHALAPEDESDGDMLARLGVDGLAWAREFCLRFSNGAVVFDEQLMLGWFANAIEAGRSAGQERATDDGEAYRAGFTDGQAAAQRRIREALGQ